MCACSRLAQMLSHVPCKAGWVGVFILLPAEHLILVCSSEKTRGGGGERQGVLIWPGFAKIKYGVNQGRQPYCSGLPDGPWIRLYGQRQLSECTVSRSPGGDETLTVSSLLATSQNYYWHPFPLFFMLRQSYNADYKFWRQSTMFCQTLVKPLT